MARGGNRGVSWAVAMVVVFVRRTWGSHNDSDGAENSQNTQASERGEGGGLEVLPLQFRHHRHKEKTTGEYEDKQRNEKPNSSNFWI
eukprot:scaffold897_cov43-Cyclotella_meneghiniana.AAC.7